MTKEFDTHRIGFLSLLVLAMLVNVLGQAIHETGHSMVYQIMGRNPVWGFTKIVQMWDAPPMNPEEWIETSFDGDTGWLKLSSPQEGKTEKVIATAAGPLSGLLGAVLGFVIARKGSSTASKQAGLALTISISFTALQYYLRSGFRIGGDEYNIAIQLGILPSLVNILLGVSFAICFILAFTELPEWGQKLKWLGMVVLGSASTGTFMFLADDLVITQVNLGNPWFRPVFGYAFPVFLVNAFALAGVVVWVRRQKSFKKPSMRTI